jgi:hypothetical protein
MNHFLTGSSRSSTGPPQQAHAFFSVWRMEQTSHQ